METDPEVIAGLRELATPLETVQAESGLADLEPLRAIIGEARIVALGEATHGTSEFFTMKHRLVEFLVQELGFTVFGMELTWADSRLVDAHLQTGEGDEQHVRAGLSIWPWQTQEVLALVDWMRAHNERPDTEVSIRFYGFDAFSNDRTIEQILSYVEQVDPPALERFSGYYASFDNGFSSALDGIDQAHAAFDNLAGQREQYAGASSARAFEEVLQNARVVIQMQQMATADNRPALRDQFMADNVEWILAQLEPEAKIILWAHNGHVAAPPYELEFRGDSYVRMGTHLRDRFGEQYLAVGFTFNAGTFRALAGTFETPPLPPDSYELTFRQLALPLFLLDLRQAQEDTPEAEWLSAPHSIWNVGASYDGSRPEEARSRHTIVDLYDLLIYIQDTSPSTPWGAGSHVA